MKSQDFKATVNDKFHFENLSSGDLDVIRTGDGRFHILHNDCSYHAELISADFTRKEISLRVNGTRYNVRLADAFDQMVNRLGLAAVAAHAVREIRAPMPGLVLQINADAGDELQKGKPLLILEAMKMENVIKAPVDVRIKKVLVHQGQAVEKGQVLMEME